MRSRRHVVQADRIGVFAISYRAVTSIVAEAVLDTNNDPKYVLAFDLQIVEIVIVIVSYHKFVNTTPNPNATKNNRGELVPPLLGLPDIVGDGALPVVVV